MNCDFCHSFIMMGHKKSLSIPNPDDEDTMISGELCSLECAIKWITKINQESNLRKQDKLENILICSQCGENVEKHCFKICNNAKIFICKANKKNIMIKHPIKLYGGA